METKKSTKMMLAEYDEARRDEATSNGRPVRRMWEGSVPLRVSVDRTAVIGPIFFFVRNGTLACTESTGQIVPATLRIIAESVTAPGRTCVPVDRDVAKRMIRMMGTLPRWSASDTDEMVSMRTAGKLLQFLGTQPVSSRFVVLTEALDRKFYAQTASPETIQGWRTAFNLNSTVSSLVTLLAYCYGPIEKMFATKADRPDNSIVTAENMAEKSCQYSGATSKASLMSASEGIHTAYAAMLALDPISRIRGVLDGTVCRVTPAGLVEGRHIEAQVSSPFKLKNGGQILMDDDPTSVRLGYTELVSIRVDDQDQMLGQFRAYTKPGQRISKTEGTFSMLDSALSAGKSMLVTPIPFLGGGRPVFSGKWGSKGFDPADAIVSRNVPLDVIAAGLRASA